MAMETNLGNAVIIAVVGFTVVFICLIFFAVVISAINKLDRVITESKQKKQLQNLQQNVAPAETEDVIPVIIAAAYSAVPGEVVVRKITFAHENEKDNTWKQISRSQNIHSHNIQKTRVIYESK
ncbi:hypothetical protein SDC9_102624 [bioreactor metagenome]|uniref:Oxaloacetate decarboxylase gamma chain n=1 Tax=bioreactor metagenome TaxID=1076179 RepID=A0A645ARY4_9ZZZZ